MIRTTVIGTLAATLSLSSSLTGAAVITYTDHALFSSVTTGETLIEDFEGLTAGHQGQSLGLAAIDVQNIPDGVNELFISTTGQVNFGLPTLSQVLTGNGRDQFDIFFNVPSTAVGFDTYVNGIGADEVISVFGESDNHLGNFILSHSSSVVGFFGVTADENITRIRLTSGSGETINNGIDNIVQANAVPVPAAVWLFGSGLLGLIGIARRDHSLR